MTDYALDWNIRFRANLRLWPEPVANISTLVSCAGLPYDEEEFLKRFTKDEAGKTPTNTRVVRNTFEILAYSGMALREDDGDVFQLTTLGKLFFSFIGTIGGRRFANEANRPLLSSYIIKSLSLIVENRCIWSLMRKCENLLTNEELNRSMNAIKTLSDVDRVADLVIEARSNGNPDSISPRAYKPEQYGTPQQSDQRKAINPHFLLAGGGGLIISVLGEDEVRRINDWAIPIIDRCLQEPVQLRHVSTNRDLVQMMSLHSGAPADVRGLS